MTLGSAISTAIALLGDGSLQALGAQKAIDDSVQFETVKSKPDSKQRKSIEQLIEEEGKILAEFERQADELENITGGKRKIEI